MLARARLATSSASVACVRSDLEHHDLPADTSDLAYSSLALHYVENLSGLLSTVHRSLRAGGRLVMSIEHPVYMAPSRPDWLIDDTGRRTWPLDRYLVEGLRTTNSLAAA